MVRGNRRGSGAETIHHASREHSALEEPEAVGSGQARGGQPSLLGFVTTRTLIEAGVGGVGHASADRERIHHLVAQEEAGVGGGLDGVTE